MAVYLESQYVEGGYYQNASILGELQAFDAGAWVEMFVLDLTNLGGGTFYFHAGVNEFYAPLVWQGITYQPLPIQANGFDFNGTGSPARPTLTVANVQGLISGLILNLQDILGGKVTRKRTMVKFLDAANFANGNPNEDPSQYLPDQVYYITQKTAENKVAVTFELGSSMDLQGVMLPRRQIIANLCAWQYRSEACGYTGGPCADINDQPTTYPAQDACSKRLAGCKLRFGTQNDLPYGGFPGSSLLTQY